MKKGISKNILLRNMNLQTITSLTAIAQKKEMSREKLMKNILDDYAIRQEVKLIDENYRTIIKQLIVSLEQQNNEINILNEKIEVLINLIVEGK